MSSDLLLFGSVRAPVAPRTYDGNMCGVRIPGAPAVPGGADSSLILSWFYPRYPPEWRAQIRAAWKRRGQIDVLVSWPDDQIFGLSPAQHVAMCLELVADGFRPNDFLSAKPTSSDQIRDGQGTLDNILLVLPLLIAAGAISRVCLAWEACLWLSPADVALLRDTLCPPLVAAGIKVYFHGGPGKSSWQYDGQNFADFWNASVGKFTGLYHEKIIDQSPEEYRGESGGLNDVLIRFAGNFGVTADSGFGHPFDCIALEITAQTQFDGTTTEGEGDAYGTWAIDTPPQGGPAGFVGVMGSGNGNDIQGSL